MNVDEANLREKLLDILRYPNNKKPVRYSILNEMRLEAIDKIIPLIESEVRKEKLKLAQGLTIGGRHGVDIFYQGIPIERYIEQLKPQQEEREAMSKIDYEKEIDNLINPQIMNEDECPECHVNFTELKQQLLALLEACKPDESRA